MPSVSVSKGEGSLNHNNRKFKTANVDPSRAHLNIILKKPCQKVLQNAYHELFDNALQKYNGRQKRDDRKIKNYLSHIQNSKQEKPFHEIVVQIGNKDNKEDYSSLLVEYSESFEKRNPQMKVVGAIVHMDEATPHLHLDYVPYITGQKRGLETRVSNDKAILQMGFKSWNDWRSHEEKAVEDILQQHGLERTIMYNTERHRTVDGYKKEQRLIESHLQTIKSQQIDLPVPTIRKNFRGREMVDYEEYMRLQEQYRLQKQENTSLKAQNQVLRAENKKVEEKLEEMKNKRYVARNEVLEHDNVDLQFQNQNLAEENRLLRSVNMDLRRDIHYLKEEVKELKGMYKAFAEFYYHLRNGLTRLGMRVDKAYSLLDGTLEKALGTSKAGKMKSMCHEHCQNKDGQERNMSIRERIERAKKQSEGMEPAEHKHRGMDLSR